MYTFSFTPSAASSPLMPLSKSETILYCQQVFSDNILHVQPPPVQPVAYIGIYTHTTHSQGVFFPPPFLASSFFPYSSSFSSLLSSRSLLHIFTASCLYFSPPFRLIALDLLYRVKSAAHRRLLSLKNWSAR